MLRITEHKELTHLDHLHRGTTQWTGHLFANQATQIVIIAFQLPTMLLAHGKNHDVPQVPKEALFAGWWLPDREDIHHCVWK